MRFQNVKAEELEGPIKLPGFGDWSKNLQHDERTTSVLLIAPSGAGKGSAIGALGESLRYAIVRCRLKQLLEYPDPIAEFKALLEGTEHLQRSVLWLDCVDGFLTRLPQGSTDGAKILENWLKTERHALAQNHIMVVATARRVNEMPPAVVDAFDQTFSG